MNIPVYSVNLVKNRSMFSRQDIKYTGTARSILPLLRRYLYKADREHHIVVLLDTEYKVIGLNTAGIGTLTAVQVHPREVFKPAIITNAYAVIICHNHPGSCHVEPSEADRKTNSLLKDAGVVLGIFLEDDIIIGEEGSYFSFREEAERDNRRKLKEQRECAIVKSRKRLDQGTGCMRDAVLLAAVRLGEMPQLLRSEAEVALERLIEGLKPIVATRKRIRVITRRRANELLQVAIEMQHTGVLSNLSKLGVALNWDETGVKAYKMPLADFWELPAGKRGK